MELFESFKLRKPINQAIEELGYTTPTKIQSQAYSVIKSGKDMVGIAQTGTGKTLAYLLPILNELKYSEQINARVLIIVPTRELVLQVVNTIESIGKYAKIRAIGVYGGVNINRHKALVADQGGDVLVATPGRLYDLALSHVLQLKDVKKLIIDEVDVMLDLGFRFQLTNILDLLSTRRQNIMFSATMTSDIDALIADTFVSPTTVSVAVSGTRLENIEQCAYKAPNYYTKMNFLNHILKDEDVFKKVLIFVPNKRYADRTHLALQELYDNQVEVIHSNKTQNYRLRSIHNFDNGDVRILVSTDVMARGLDLNQISHVINVDVPSYPENYMHRIGRTGRAKSKGKAMVVYTPKEVDDLIAIETLMAYKIPKYDLPIEVEISKELTPEERPKILEINNPHKDNSEEKGASFHEKKDKNKKTNLGGSYRRKMAVKYKKPKTKGDKIANRKRAKRK